MALFVFGGQYLLPFDGLLTYTWRWNNNNKFKLRCKSFITRPSDSPDELLYLFIYLCTIYCKRVFDIDTLDDCELYNIPMRSLYFVYGATRTLEGERQYKTISDQWYLGQVDADGLDWLVCQIVTAWCGDGRRQKTRVTTTGTSCRKSQQVVYSEKMINRWNCFKVLIVFLWDRLNFYFTLIIKRVINYLYGGG